MKQLERPVRDVMTEPVRAVEGDLPVSSTAQILWGNDIGSVIVGERTVEGIVTESDIVRTVCAGYDLDRMQVRELMTEPVITIGPDATVREASTLMQDNDIKKLPVTEDGDPVGIVTTTDLSRALASTFEDLLQNPSQ